MASALTAAPPAEPLDQRTSAQLRKDLVDEYRGTRAVPMPRGRRLPTKLATIDAFNDPLGVLLRERARWGSVFSLRHGWQSVVWALSAEANHDILVRQADAFGWRESRFRDLWTLMGDGFFAIDGEYHRQVRRMMLPGFHAAAVEGVADAMVAQIAAALDQVRAPAVLDINGWVRDVAMRVALRVLLGIDRSDAEIHRIADAFERALVFHGAPMPAQMLRGPFTPYARTVEARRELDDALLGEIRRRRAEGDESGPGVLGLLLGCTDGDGAPLPEQLVRDLAITVMFAGHDTTTATFTFMTLELGRTPAAREALEAELDTVLGGAAPTAAQLDGKALPVLERTIDETLRRFPPAWVGPRRSLREVELDGVRIPAGVAVHYSSWITHHLAEYYAAPLAFDPDRFLPGGEVAQLPKGAYVPFGGGSRMCVGKRFAQYELRALTALALQRLRLDPDPSDTFVMALTPTLGPKHGLRCFVSARA